ncbi:MAG: T9SS type A sorting domain-containing protein [Bacteroidales bacterium]|nr:T9SS type A sorting domain-containing protein [Bacteroidales bacterium]
MKKSTSLCIVFLSLLFNSTLLTAQTNQQESSIQRKSSGSKEITSLPLPFSEGWNQGSFEFNSWTWDSDNWIINQSEGNPAPSAEFSQYPLLQNNYSSALTSALFDATQLSESQIYLGFDIKLDNRVNTHTEFLRIEVFNGIVWDTIAAFNNNGSFNWTSYHISISQYSFGNLFQVRFVASGEDSHNINSWGIDNIEIYQTCDPPTDLYCTEYNLEDILVSWNAPVGPSIAEWIYYDDATIEYVWGSETEDWSSDQAIRFAGDQLIGMNGAAITKIKVFIDSRLIGIGTIHAKIWQGADAANLIYEEDITAQITHGDDFNEVILATPVPFDNAQELWIGVHTSGPPNSFGVGITTNMSSWDENADLLNRGNGWEHIQNMGIYNRAWLLRAFVTSTFQTKWLGHLEENNDLSASGSFVPLYKEISLSKEPTTRNLSGFNIYKQAGYNTDFELYTFVPAIDSVIACSFLDTGVGVYLESNCYQVTCVWEGATDYCESEPGLSFIGNEDMACILIYADVNYRNTNTLEIYPNPSNDHITINSPIQIIQLSLLNYSGQEIRQMDIAGENKIEINTSTLQPGIYLLRIKTVNGIVTKRVVINR